MAAPKILALAGSLRTGSYNKQLIRVAAETARQAGAEVTLVDLRDFPLPVYDGDAEAQEGLPEQAKRLQALFIAHPGLLFASPEYNSSIPGAFKNALDWVSRPAPGAPDLAAFSGKVAALLSASPGMLGGLRGLVPLRAMLGNIGALVIPQQLALSKAHEAFNPDGSLKDPKQLQRVAGVTRALVDLLGKLAPA